MTTLREAATRALEALETEGEHHQRVYAAITALKAALAEHFCDNHCTWLDHAPGCVRAEPQTTHWEGCSAVHPECAKAEAARIRAAMQRLTDVQQEIQTALAEPVQEPVAWMDGYQNVYSREEKAAGCEDASIPLYTAPPQRKPLAEWQINDLMADIDPEDVDSWSFRQGVYAAEKHHGVRP